MERNCRIVRERLTAFVDGEVSEERKQRIEAHLAQCAECRRSCEEIAAVGRLADTWQVEGADVWEKVRRAVETDAIFSEMEQLRNEVRSLRLEVAELRRQVVVQPQEPGRWPLPMHKHEAAPRISSLGIV